ncbi:MAG: CapA family protein [Betaproteobacteria bacterium]|nr:CapA family protein [Betaproteobacteria bacterium]
MASNVATHIVAVGDICVNRTNPDSIFDLIRDEISHADLAFCQIETTYSLRGAVNLAVHVPLRAAPENVSAIARAGFNVASFASNHCMDWGEDACIDTITHLNSNGVQTIGAGRNLTEARKPLIVKHNGNSIGWLAYCSILPPNYWAQPQRAGCAPARARTFYEAIESDQPGTPSRVLSYPHEEDLNAMCSDIRTLKKSVDIVIVSMHWGVHFKEAEIASYQRAYGRSAVDSGADIILGHHAHILKPVEIYQGKPIFYSLCNFAFDLTYNPGQWDSPERVERRLKLNPTWQIDPEYTSYPFPRDSRKSILVRITCENKKIERVSCAPVLINKESQPRLLRRSDMEFDDVLSYLTRITKDQGLSTEYAVSGDELVPR